MTQISEKKKRFPLCKIHFQRKKKKNQIGTIIWPPAACKWQQVDQLPLCTATCLSTSVPVCLWKWITPSFSVALLMTWMPQWASDVLEVDGWSTSSGMWTPAAGPPLVLSSLLSWSVSRQPTATTLQISAQKSLGPLNLAFCFLDHVHSQRFLWAS